MGALFSALMSLINPQQEYKLVIVGLDNAGKTTTLFKLHLVRRCRLNLSIPRGKRLQLSA